MLKLERRLSHEGMVERERQSLQRPRHHASSGPHVHVFADEIRIFEDGALIATDAPLEGRDQRLPRPDTSQGLAASAQTTGR
jgi:hypothetical protein